MSLSLNTSDPLYNNICMCIMADGSSVVDVANPTVTFTRNASGTTNVIAPGTYGNGYGLDGSGSFTSFGWSAANIPATLGPAGTVNLPGNTTNNHSSVFVALNSFASANNHGAFFGASTTTNKPGVGAGVDSLYMASSGTSTALSGTQTPPTTSPFTMMTTWNYNAGAGGAQIYYGASSTPDVTGASSPTGGTANLLTLGPTSGQGNVHASLFCIVILDTIVSGADYLRLANSLTGSGAFALVTSSGGGGSGPAFLLLSVRHGWRHVIDERRDGFSP